MLTSYFRIAKRASKRSDNKIKVGAVLVKKKPISSGFNKDKTHTKYANPKGHLDFPFMLKWIVWLE